MASAWKRLLIAFLLSLPALLLGLSAAATLLAGPGGPRAWALFLFYAVPAAAAAWGAAQVWRGRIPAFGRAALVAACAAALWLVFGLCFLLTRGTPHRPTEAPAAYR